VIYTIFLTPSDDEDEEWFSDEEQVAWRMRQVRLEDDAFEEQSEWPPELIFEISEV